MNIFIKKALHICALASCCYFPRALSVNSSFTHSMFLEYNRRGRINPVYCYSNTSISSCFAIVNSVYFTKNRVKDIKYTKDYLSFVKMAILKHPISYSYKTTCFINLYYSINSNLFRYGVNLKVKLYHNSSIINSSLEEKYNNQDFLLFCNSYICYYFFSYFYKIEFNVNKNMNLIVKEEYSVKKKHLFMQNQDILKSNVLNSKYVYINDMSSVINLISPNKIYNDFLHRERSILLRIL